MDNLLLYLIQVNILLSIIFVGYYVLLRNLTFYRLNRLYFMLGTVYALLYPLMDLRRWFTRTIEVEMPLAWAYLPETFVRATTTSLFTLHNLLLAAAIGGATIFLISFTIQLLSLLRVHLNSTRSLWQNYLYRNVRYPIAPFSFFNKIYLHKAQHQEPELYDIFEHENIHVKGLHSIDIIWFEILWIVCWFNPFLWLMRRAVRQNLEFLTDQQVLNKGIDRKTYQYSLLHVTQHGAAVNMGNQFNFKTLKKRIMMMNKKRSSKLELSKYAFLLPIFILIGASFTVSKTEHQVEEVVAKVKETAMDALMQPEPSETFDKDENASNPLALNSQDSAKRTGTVEMLKSRSEIDRNKDYYYEYDKKAISKAEFFALRDDEVYDILLIEDAQAFSALHPVAKDKDGVVRAYSLEMHEQRKIDAERVLFVIDGEIDAEGDIKKIDPNTIEAISVLKGELAVAKYGEKAKHGVVEITSKKSQAVKHDSIKISSVWFDGKKIDMETADSVTGLFKGQSTGIRLRGIPTNANGAQPLIVIDGKQMPVDYRFASVDPNTIASISVLKDKSASALYGPKAKDGVIIITTKSGSSDSDGINNSEQSGATKKAKIEEVTVVGYQTKHKKENTLNELDSQPEPVGGMTSFRQWVANNLVYPKAAIDAGAKGTMLMSFIVEADGSLQNIKTLNDIGFGTSESAINTLKKAKKWKPGIQGGKPVAVEYTFPIRLDLSRG